MKNRAPATVLLASLLLAGCGTTATPASPAPASPGQTATDAPGHDQVTLRLGYFPNVTHATALVGDRGGIFERVLGDSVDLRVQNFNAGGEAIEAIFNGGIDMTYIGPNPAINGFIRSQGQAVRLIAGATSGGAFFVVREGIDSADDLRGKVVSSPALGNTQDVALRAWLGEQGLATDVDAGGDVSITPLSNSDILEGFISGSVDGAWVPEPWATRMIQQGGQILVDERDLWPNGEYVTTHVLVATAFLERHPEVVRRFLEAHLEASDFVNEDPGDAQRLVSEGINAITGTEMNPGVLSAAWDNLSFTVDPIASSLQESAEDAHSLGFLEGYDPETGLQGIYDLTLLNEVLRDAGRPEVPQP
jgi:NitT/TauT family transport system substrate-binding protein